MTLSFTRHVFTVPSLITPDERREGPASNKITDLYASAPNEVKNNIRIDNGVQIWTVPYTGTYRISANGAQGGTGSRSGSGGYGAAVRGDFLLEQGKELHMLIGQEGRRNGAMVGGGGGTFVYLSTVDDDLLLVAGGGGGYGVGNSSDFSRRAHANSDEVGHSGYGNPHGSSMEVSGGSGGNGGSAARTRGCGGGGWKSDGATAQGGVNNGGGFSIINGDFGKGGNGGPFQDGSFGGGGAVNKMSSSWGACGGGGGYSGGGGGYASGPSSEAAGGGGGSYVRGTAENVIKLGGIDAGNTGEGSVEVRYIPDTSGLGGSVDYDEELVRDRISDITMNEANNRGSIVKNRLMNQMTLQDHDDKGRSKKEIVTQAQGTDKQYKEISDMMTVLNESGNANVYITENIEKELIRVKVLNDKAQNEVAKTQQRQLMTDHAVNHTDFMTRILVITCFVTGVLFVPIAAKAQGWLPVFLLWVVVIAVLGIYALILTGMFLSRANRRQTHWKQAYARESDEMKKQVCKFKSDGPIVSVFSRCDFKGDRHNIKSTGKYDGQYVNRHMSQGVGSIGVRNGYAIRLYLGSDFSGESQTLVRNVNCVMDDIKSLEVVGIKDI